MKNKKWLVPLMAVFLLFAMVSAVEAHVTVHPNKSTTNAYEKYTVRVPVEKDINTTEVTLKVPDGVTLVSVMPMANWDYKLDKDDNDRITSVTWTATNGGIKSNEFVELAFIAANPSEPGDISWKALQTYADGSVVEWAGSPDADKPASVTTIEQADAAGHLHDNAEDNVAQDDESSDAGTTNWLPIALSVVALLLAVISLFRKRN